MSSFLQFVIDNQLPIAKDVEKPWFKKVWLPLTMRQISVKDEAVMGSSQLTIHTKISITSDILDFLGYEGQIITKQQNFERLLNRAEIPFKRIAYDDFNADDAVKEDGLKLTKYNRQKKRWITMDVSDFKDSLMMLNTKRAKEIRLYYRNLESAVFKFIHHSLDIERRKVEEKNIEIRQLELNNTGLQGEITAMDREIARRDQQATELQIEVARLRQRYVDYCRDPGKDNVIMIFRKHTCKDDDKYFEYPYYIARIQRRKVSTKRRKLRKRFPRGVIIDSPNSVHKFNRLEEEGHVERYQCHFKLTDLTREDLYDMGVPAIEE